MKKTNKRKNWRAWSKLFHRVIGAAVVALSLGAFTVSAQALTKSEIMRMVIEEAQATSVPPALALAVARNESNFDANALSPKGARGVMQIMPKTGADVYGVAADELWDPRLNIQIGIDFLEGLIERYNGRWELALSYYNGGSAVGNLPNARVLPATRSIMSMRSWPRTTFTKPRRRCGRAMAARPSPGHPPAPMWRRLPQPTIPWAFMYAGPWRPRPDKLIAVARCCRCPGVRLMISTTALTPGSPRCAAPWMTSPRS